MPTVSPAEDEWQRTANAIGLGLGVAGVGFSVSQLAKRPELALAGLLLGGVVTTVLWSRRRAR